MKKKKEITQSQIEELLDDKSQEVDISLDEKKSPVIGLFTPKRKFLNFVTGLKGRVRLLSNYAFIKGEQFSGMLEGSVFKVTICDEGTINFEEVDTNQTTSDMIKNFIDEIDSRDVTGYTKKFVVSGLEFYDDDAKPCYLEVEHTKPIDKLFSLFDEDSDQEISEAGMSILDALFNSETDEELQREFEGESDEEIQLSMKDVQIILDAVDNPPVPNESLKNAAQSFMEESFKKMNDDKIIELKDRIDKTEKEIVKLNYEIKQSESKLDSSKENLRVLNTRLSSLQPKDDPVGYDFFISSEIKSEIEPDENLVAVVEKLAPIMKLNVPVVIDMLTGSHFNIKIKNQNDEEEVSRDIVQKISKIDLSGSITMITSTEYEYRGELNWHQLVDKMIRMGFEQNPEFDKECGSNSYESEKQDETITDENIQTTNQ